MHRNHWQNNYKWKYHWHNCMIFYPDQIQELLIIWIWLRLLFWFLFLQFVFLYRIYHTWPRHRLFRQARRELNLIFKNHQSNYIPAVNALLKKQHPFTGNGKILLVYIPMSGWNFLTTHPHVIFPDILINGKAGPYSGSGNLSKRKKEVLRECRKWLRSNRNRRPLWLTLPGHGLPVYYLYHY